MEKVPEQGGCFHALPMNFRAIYLAFPTAYAYVCEDNKLTIIY